MLEGVDLGHTDDVSGPGSRYRHRVGWGRGGHCGLWALFKVRLIFCLYAPVGAPPLSESVKSVSLISLHSNSMTSFSNL